MNARPSRASRCTNATFGAQLRAWRQVEGVSQETLAGRAGVSARHLCFVENARAQPSRALVVSLAVALNLAPRERDLLLSAAGFAAGARAALDDDSLRALRFAVDQVLEQHEPFGALAVDREWNLSKLNRGAARLFRRFPVTGSGFDAFRNLVLGMVHPGALRRYIVNWLDVAGQAVARLVHEVTLHPGDRALARLLACVLAQPGVPAAWRTLTPGRRVAPHMLVHLRSDQLDVRLNAMMMSIGTPLDATADEVRLVTWFPADQATEAALRALEGC